MQDNLPGEPMPDSNDGKKGWLVLLVGGLAALGAIFILLIASFIWLVSGPVPKVPGQAVLTLDLDAGYGEVGADSLLADLGAANPLSFNDLLTVLDAAAADVRVEAIAARIAVSDLGLAQKQELRKAIRMFRLSGKPAYIFAPGFGFLSGGISEYYLATAFDEITMMPNTDIGFTGIGVEVPFARAALDKVGVTPEFFSRYEYKSAMASFTDKKASAAFDENMSGLVTELNFLLLRDTMKQRFQQASTDEALDYGLDFLKKAPLTAEYAQSMGLIDKIAYEGDWLDDIKTRHNARTISLVDYAANIHLISEAKKIAVITLDGTIVDKPSAAWGEKEVSVAQVLETVDELADRTDLAGVLVRIDSPGGSYTAANEIRHALVRLKEKKKIPLVVSMGNYAASGGYFVALAGDEIFALPMTITGSIGVFGGKFVLENLWDKIGVNWKAYTFGDNTTILSPHFKFSKSQRKVFEASLDRVYQDFTAKVMQARGLDADKMDKLARGRVWDGKTAVLHHLVDAEGGFKEALTSLRKKAQIAAHEKVTMLFYPRPKTMQEKIAELTVSAPQIAAKRLKMQFGLDKNLDDVLQRLQYDAVMPPFIIRY